MRYYSWPCLHQWLETRPNRQVCPVCKSAISKEKVVPLYGRGSKKTGDPRETVPPRPAGQRTEPEPGSSFPGKRNHLNFNSNHSTEFQDSATATTVSTCRSA